MFQTGCFWKKVTAHLASRKSSLREAPVFYCRLLEQFWTPDSAFAQNTERRGSKKVEN